MRRQAKRSAERWHNWRLLVQQHYCVYDCRWWELWVSDHTVRFVMCGRTCRTSATASSWWLSVTVDKSKLTSSWCVACYGRLPHSQD